MKPKVLMNEKGILIMKSLFITIIFILVQQNVAQSQVMSTDELRKVVFNEDFNIYWPYEIPIDLYYLDSSLAIEVVCSELEKSLQNDKGIREPSQFFDVARFCEKNNKLSELLFDYYKLNINKLRNHSCSFRKISGDGSRISDKLLFALINQSPDGLLDTLVSDLKFLQQEAEKIHPDSCSFFEEIWLNIKTFFNPHDEYRHCMYLCNDISMALSTLGQDKILNDTSSEIDSSNINKIWDKKKNDIYYFEKNPFKNISNGTIKQLKNNYTSINDLVISDSVLNYEILNGVARYCRRPILVNGNEAIIWYAVYSSGYLIKLILINQNTARIINITGYVL